MKPAASAALLVAIASIAGQCKNKPTIKIRVVDAQAGERHVARYVPGKAGHSTTACNGSVTVSGSGSGMATGTTTSNCTTVSDPGTQPHTVTNSIPEVHLHAILPDGRRVVLWCQKGFRRCEGLSPGVYTAQVDGNSIWIHTADLSGKDRKMKYRYAGGW